MGFLSQWLNQALQHHHAGQLAQAEALYRQILQHAPNHAEAWHLLGVLAYQAKNYAVAVELINQAIQRNPTVPFFYNNLGNALSEQQQFEEAITCYQRALTLHPQFAEAHHNLGNVFNKQNQLAQAVACYQRALQLNPNYLEAYHSLGIALDKQGMWEAAVSYLRQALQLNPQYVEAHNSLGNVLKKQGEGAQAEACFQQALRWNPHYVEAHYNLGNLWREQGQLDSAWECYQQAVKLRPEFAEAWVGLGEILVEQGHGALTYFQQALKVNPTCVEAIGNLGNLFLEQSQLSEAIVCYQQILTLQPEEARTHNNLGNAWVKSGHIQEALKSYQRALQIEPSYVTAHSNWLLALNYVDNYEAAEIFAEHQKFDAQHVIPRQHLIQPIHRRPHRPLKIGYISQDFRKHSVAYFIEPILAHHDHRQFKIYGYYNYLQQDEVTHRLQRLADVWVNCYYLSDKTLVERIRADQIDILVDLMGHTGRNRILIFAHRPAPIQVTYLGYSNTTGLSTMDYRITDSYTDPPGLAEPLSSETLVRMPHSYFCYSPGDETLSMPTSPPVLDNGYLTFGSFNNYAKLSPTLLALWAQILQAVPHSKLLVKAGSLKNQATQQALRDFFTQWGIASERLLIADFVPAMQTHLSSYHQVDVALDSYPYNGATTTCETLWMGVPVVTLVGKTHVSRMGLSILATSGLTELIAETPQTYVAICVKLANDLEYLQTLRKTLRERLKKSPLMAAAAFTHQLENEYHTMWQTWCNFQ